MISLLLFLAMVLSLALAAFCAGAETAFLSVSRERILHLSRAGGRKAAIIQRALANMGETTTSLLIGNNLASVAYSAASAALCFRLCRGSVMQSVWSFAAAFTVLYVSEFIPKLLCAARPLRWSLTLAPSYRLFVKVMMPFTIVALRMTDIFLPRRETRYKLTTDDLLRILRDRKDGVCLSDFESALIGRIIVCRIKGKKLDADSLISVLKES